MRVRNNKSKSTMNKSEEHEVGERSAIRLGIVRTKVKSKRNKNIKNESEKQ
jgi:hypothetical protein